eukprot:TRINITY_DN8483_c0_g1_i5.p1 TRINITY_DN8483_c0_g1~~TRINITY_DN8483_c0_g1_i5.p1  ORF type:complete len:164 (-),score=36.20 TRINITY_DN8483_c0_g1_i5:156-647(-)
MNKKGNKIFFTGDEITYRNPVGRGWGMTSNESQRWIEEDKVNIKSRESHQHERSRSVGKKKTLSDNVMDEAQSRGRAEARNTAGKENAEGPNPTKGKLPLASEEGGVGTRLRREPNYGLLRMRSASFETESRFADCRPFTFNSIHATIAYHIYLKEGDAVEEP